MTLHHAWRLMLAFCLSEAVATAQDLSPGASFSKDEPVDDAELAALSQKPEELDALDGKIEVDTTVPTSFPVRLDFGLAAAEDWRNTPREALTPPRKFKKLRIGGCSFKLVTNNYTVNTFTVSGVGDYEIANSSLKPQTALALGAYDNVFMNVAAELKVEVAGEHVEACKKRFKKPKELPVITFTSELTAITKKGLVKPIKNVRDAESDRMFLVWDSAHKTLVLRNEAGFAPIVESPVVKFTGEPGLAMYLSFKPEWKLSGKISS